MADKSPFVVTVPTTEVVTDLTQVDSYLAGLYRRAAGVEEPGAIVPVVRALLFTLVVYASTLREAEDAANDVSEVAGSHPCRAIIVDTSAFRAGEPPTIVTVVCGITERGDRRLCGEIIRLHIQPVESDVVGSVIPLLVSDVPVVLWVPGEIPTDNEGFKSLVRVADRMIIDSRRSADLKVGLASVSSRCSQSPAGCSVHDLAWTSLTPWRELTAQHFDPLTARGYLSKLARVSVRYAEGERRKGPSCAAVLYTAWLIDRAHLKIRRVSAVDTGDCYIEALQEDLPVEIRLISEKQGYASGALTSITIQCGDGNGTAMFVTKGISGTELYVSEECKGVCLVPQVLDMPPQSPAALAAQALDSLRRDMLYEEALNTAQIILEEK